MTGLDRTKRMNDALSFIRETDKIIITILKYYRIKEYSPEQILTQWNKFIKLAQNASLNGTDSLEPVQMHNLAIVEAFKLFENEVPQIKKVTSKI